MPDNSIDAIVTDPPYGLAFMGKKWDYDVPSEEIWRECLRVLKPGGHLLAFAGTRTQHRMAVRIEDAGFEIRDMIAWVYGSGFPKSHDISKAIDKQAGAERERTGNFTARHGGKAPNAVMHAFVSDQYDPVSGKMFETAPATPAAKTWQGWGTALKPALEPITVARKPFTGTVAANVLQWGTGGVNVDGSRVPCESGQGRFPANLIHDGSDEVVGLFPETKATGRPECIGKKYDGVNNGSSEIYNNGYQSRELNLCYSDSGSAARFFYCAKASKRDRDEGCEGMAVRPAAAMAGNMVDGQRLAGNGTPISTPARANHHPTVKPTDLMRYLCRLVTPPNGTVLDPFMGSGSTGKAAILEGFQFIGIDMTPEYVDIARARIEHAFKNKQNTLDL
jgi:site-specific DNA-methyltransferase (adenine-specific)